MPSSSTRRSLFWVVGTEGKKGECRLESSQTPRPAPPHPPPPPQVVTRDELYGSLHPTTREWRDGLVSRAFRDAASKKGVPHQWIVLDGDIDPEWIEVGRGGWGWGRAGWGGAARHASVRRPAWTSNPFVQSHSQSMNTVMDDNKAVCVCDWDGRGGWAGRMSGKGAPLCRGRGRPMHWQHSSVPTGARPAARHHLPGPDPGVQRAHSAHAIHAPAAGNRLDGAGDEYRRGGAKGDPAAAAGVRHRPTRRLAPNHISRPTAPPPPCPGVVSSTSTPKTWAGARHAVALWVGRGTWGGSECIAQPHTCTFHASPTPPFPPDRGLVGGQSACQPTWPCGRPDGQVRGVFCGFGLHWNAQTIAPPRAPPAPPNLSHASFRYVERTLEHTGKAFRPAVPLPAVNQVATLTRLMGGALARWLPTGDVRGRFLVVAGGWM